jgi:hypothetical protein
MSMVSARCALVHGKTIMNVLMGMKQYHSVGDCFVPRSDMAIRGMTAPSAFGTSPKSPTGTMYDIDTAYDHFNLGGRIWGRRCVDLQASRSV